MFRVYNPVFNLGFRVHSFLPTKATFSSHFLYVKTKPICFDVLCVLDGKFAVEERERET